MEQANTMSVEVIYALPTEQKIITLEVEEGSTIETVIDRSGVLLMYPEIDLSKNKVGIFSKTKKLTDQVGAGDRVEIYRPLLIDPKEARRARGVKSKRIK